MIPLMSMMDNNQSKIMLQIPVMNLFISYNFIYRIENGEHNCTSPYFNCKACRWPRQENTEHDVPTPGKKHLCNVFLNEILVIIYKKKLMQHFHIIAAIPSPLLQVQPGEKSTRETDQQILEDALLAHYVKRRKVKKK